MPVKLRRPFVIALAAVVALPVLALADAYTVTMRNGTSFHCRAQPQAAPWDSTKSLLRTDVGNWISLKQADVLSVVSDTENRGYGKVLSSTAMMLGEAPNDAPDGGDDGDVGDDGPAAPYSVNQFVEPGQTQGLPGSWIGGGYGGGSSGSSGPAPAPRVAPVAAAAAAAAAPSPPGN